MFSKQDTTYKSQSKSRKFVYLALAGAAMMVGTVLYQGFKPAEPLLHAEESFSFLEKAKGMHAYQVRQADNLERLIKKGGQVIGKSETSIEDLLTVLNTGGADMKTSVAPGLTNGAAALTGNVEFGQEASDTTIKPEEVTKDFADSANFIAKISTIFPEEYAEVAKLRQDLKVHHFTLAGLITDVELLADSTKSNLSKAFRKLALRKKYLNDPSKEVTPKFDLKIWKYEVKSQIGDIDQSLIKCTKLVEDLVKLRDECVRTSDSLKNVILNIQEALDRRIKEKQVEVDGLRSQIEGLGCNFWEMIFTFGEACRKADALKSELRQKMSSFEHEVEVASSLFTKMNYFDGIKKLSNTLVEEADGLLVKTKAFESKLKDTKYELEQDFSPEEIEDNLGDVDFATDFAEQLFEALNKLSVFCDEVMADCKDRRGRLTHALIWDEITAPAPEGEAPGEEELVNLEGDDESDAMTLMNHFYRDLAAGCDEYFHAASKKFAGDVRKFQPHIDQLGDHKYLLMNYAREEYGTMKQSLFVILDSLRDSQRDIESTQDYFGGNAVKSMSKRIDDPRWKYQLKYSTKLTKRCANDAPKLAEFSDALDASAEVVAQQMQLIKASFAVSAAVDLASWNCAAMYPAPVRADLGVPGWLGGITNIAKRAFTVYNGVKRLIPGGTTAGAGLVPGSGAELEELTNLMGLPANIGWKEVEGVGSKLLGELVNEDPSREQAWANRQLIWRRAMAMCREDRARFERSIAAVDSEVSTMVLPIRWAPFTAVDDNLLTQLDGYTAETATVIKADSAAEMTKEEHAAVSANLTALDESLSEALEYTQKAGEAAAALKMMLLRGEAVAPEF